MNEKEIAAGIVVYKPNVERLDKCISKLKEQLDVIYVYNNDESDIDYEWPETVVLLSEKSNKGLSYALNRIMERAKENGFKWIITMDQDSILPDGIVEAYLEAIRGNSELGIVCPQIIDDRRAYMEIKKSPEEELLDFCITSASCTNIECWEKIGKYDEWLFIDLIDNDFCKRLRESEYKILRLNKYVLNQEFGVIIPKKEKSQRFWIKLSKILKNENIAKFSYKKIVNPMRVYYTNRNIIYVNKKLKKYGKVAYKDNYNCNNYLGFWISFNLPSFLRAQKKLAVIKAIFTGMIEGIRSEVKE